MPKYYSLYLLLVNIQTMELIFLKHYLRPTTLRVHTRTYITYEVMTKTIK